MNALLFSLTMLDGPVAIFRLPRASRDTRIFRMEEATTVSSTTSPLPATASSEAVLEGRANDVVDRHVAWAAAAGVIPVPVLDVVAVAGVQLRMLQHIAAVYDVPFSENRG